MHLRDPVQYLAAVRCEMARQTARQPVIDLCPAENERFRVIVILGNRRATYREMIFADPSLLAARIREDFEL